MRLKMPFMCLFFVAAFLASFSAYAQSSNPQETLNQYISDLQKNPNDYALREKIIKLVQTMKPAPAIPEEARRNYVMAKTLFKDAKNIQDYNDALAKFKTALLLAPWWAEAYLDMGLAYEAAQQYAEAINALKLYVVANPDSEKARKAQDEIYIIEAKKEKAAKETSAEAIAERPRNKQEDFLRSLQGAVWVKETPDGVRRFEVTLMGDRLTISCIVIKNDQDTYVRKGERCPEWDDFHYGPLAAARVNGFQIYGPNWKGEITPDGKIIKLYLPNWATGQGIWENIYFRER